MEFVMLRAVNPGKWPLADGAACVLDGMRGHLCEKRNPVLD